MMCFKLRSMYAPLITPTTQVRPHLMHPKLSPHTFTWMGGAPNLDPKGQTFPPPQTFPPVVTLRSDNIFERSFTCQVAVRTMDCNSYTTILD